MGSDKRGSRTVLFACQLFASWKLVEWLDHARQQGLDDDRAGGRMGSIYPSSKLQPALNNVEDTCRKKIPCLKRFGLIRIDRSLPLTGASR